TTGDLAAEAVGGDLFISKIDTSGQIAWSRQFGAGPEHWLEVGRAITVDEDGNAFIAGYTQGELGDDYAGGQDMVVVKFDTDGTMGWTKQFGTASDDDLYGITLGNNGELYAVGVSNGQFPGAVYSGTGPVIVKLIDNESIPGDANGDGQVTAADLVILDANFGQAGTFIDGDFNGDGTVTAADLVILDANFGAGVGSVTSTSTIAAIPVPSSLALLGFGGVLLLRRRGS
ncbi:MAG: SBBP repeat-containing protein, partial [Planctomycetota bacterium]